MERGELRQCAGTPKYLFRRLHEEYRFDIDICANEFNAKLPVWVGEEENSLFYTWEGYRVWCNPPYNKIPYWLYKCQEPEFIAYLLPVRADRIWWMRFKPMAECHYFVGESPHQRVQFVPPPGIKYSANNGANVLLLFGKDTEPGKEVWRSGRTGERI